MKRYVLLLLLMCLGVSEVLALGLKAVKYTVTSKTTLLAEGDEPIGSMATFIQTGAGQKGQMTAGSSTTFTLVGLNAIHLRSITLEMRSNQSSGAGWMQIGVGDSVLAYIPDTPFTAWYGEYTNSFVPIEWQVQGSGYTFLPIEAGGDGTTLEIYIEASANSLYVASYTLHYTTEPPTAHTVTFQTNTSAYVTAITEETIGGGVLLPDCADADSVWYFKGWTLQQVPETNQEETLPTIYTAGERFYPIIDTELYALYTDCPTAISNNWIQDTIFESGYYLIADSIYQRIAVGRVGSDGRLTAETMKLQTITEDRLHICSISEYIDDMVYFIDFLPDSMATIQHVSSGRYVGYPATSSNALKNAKTEWNYRITPLKQVVFYHRYTPNDWREFRVMHNSNVTEYYWGCSAAHSSLYANILFNILDAPTAGPLARYTSFPLGSRIDDIFAQYLRIMPWGIANEAGLAIYLYALDGKLLLQTHSDIHFATLPSGYYMVGVEGIYQKIFIP